MKNQAIRTPIRLYVSRIRDRVLPPIFFLLLAVGCLLLWGRYPSSREHRGVVEAHQVDLIATTHGQLMGFPGGPLEAFRPVEAGELLARLDDASLATRLKTLGARLDEAQLELDAARELFVRRERAAEWDQRFDEHRAVVDLEQLQLTLLQRQADLAVDRIGFQRESERYELTRTLVAGMAESEFNLLLTEFRRDTIARQIEEHERFIEEAEELYATTQRRINSFPSQLSMDIEVQLAPYRARVGVIEAELEGLEVQRRQLEIRAPLSGVISQVHVQPGQNVMAGTPIVTLSESVGRSLLVYVRQENQRWPVQGDPAEIESPNQPQQTFESRVEAIGPRFELLPEVLRRTPDILEWGRPIRISLPDEFQGVPGQIVSVTFQSASASP